MSSNSDISPILAGSSPILGVPVAPKKKQDAATLLAKHVLSEQETSDGNPSPLPKHTTHPVPETSTTIQHSSQAITKAAQRSMSSSETSPLGAPPLGASTPSSTDSGWATPPHKDSDDSIGTTHFLNDSVDAEVDEESREIAPHDQISLKKQELEAAEIALDLTPGRISADITQENVVAKEDFIIKIVRDNASLIRLDLMNAYVAQHPNSRIVHDLQDVITKTKQTLVREAQELGLIPKKHEREVHEDHITSEENFFTTLAYWNSLATIPPDHPALIGNPSLQKFVDAYNKIALPLQTAWERSPSHATLQKCIKVSKNHFHKTIFIKQESEIARGSSKAAYQIHLFKPQVTLPGPTEEVVDRQKVKVAALALNPSADHSASIQRECTITKTLEENGVRNTLHMSAIRVLSPTSPIQNIGAMSEVCQGGTLDGYLTSNPTTSKETRKRLAIELCTALDDMHTKVGWCHSDLKPQNVLIQLDEHGGPHIKLADFGSTVAIGARTGFLSSYVSPEQYEDALQGNPIVARTESDAYVLGELLSNLLLNKYYLHKHGLSFDKLVKDNHIRNSHPPFADPAHAELVRNDYKALYDKWAARASRGEPFSELLTHLFDTNRSTRWTVKQAQDFLRLCP